MSGERESLASHERARLTMPCARVLAESREPAAGNRFIGSPVDIKVPFQKEDARLHSSAFRHPAKPRPLHRGNRYFKGVPE